MAHNVLVQASKVFINEQNQICVKRAQYYDLLNEDNNFKTTGWKIFFSIFLQVLKHTVGGVQSHLNFFFILI